MKMGSLLLRQKIKEEYMTIIEFGLSMTMESNMLQHYPLFQECLQALNVSLLPAEKSESLSRLFEQIIPITKWGKVDWDAIERKIVIGYDQHKIIEALEHVLKKTLIRRST
jgi:hypothetical protein